MNDCKDNIYITEYRKEVDVWKVVIMWLSVVLLLSAIVFVITKASIKRTSIQNDSYTVTYKGILYNVVPDDLIKQNKVYGDILRKYNMAESINYDSIGKCISQNDNYMLYEVKGSKVKDILILHDINGEYVYAFSEKLFK